MRLGKIIYTLLIVSGNPYIIELMPSKILYRSIKKEAFELFEYMLDGINAKFLRRLYKCIKENIEYFKENQKNNSLVDNETSQDQGELHINLTRNDPCYCKSGKTYKHCHGKIKG